MVQVQPPMPAQDPIAQRRDWKNYPKPVERDPNEGLITDAWVKWLQFSQDTLQATPRIFTNVIETDQAASISTTPFPNAQISGGLYRLSYSAQITQASAGTSSLTISFLWTSQDGTSQVATSAAMTGNTLTTVQSGSIVINSEVNAPISYSTTYASLGGPPDMEYTVSFVMENLNR